MEDDLMDDLNILEADLKIMQHKTIKIKTMAVVPGNLVLYQNYKC